MPRWSKVFQVVAPDGSVATGIACGSSPRRQCVVANCRAPATFQCDYPVNRATATRTAKPATCDRWLCRKHATSAGPDRDHCPPHARMAEVDRAAGLGREAQLALPLPKKP